MNDTHPGKVIKFCPKCGCDKFHFDGTKAFKCEQCGLHFFINASAAVAAIIVNDKGEVLLTRRAFDPCKGMLDLPGGFVDAGEPAEQAVHREIKEELNLEIEQMEYLASFPNEYVFSNYSVFTTDFGYLCRVKSFDNIYAEDDISGYEFVSKDELNYDEISSDSIRQIVKYYFEKYY